MDLRELSVAEADLWERAALEPEFQGECAELDELFAADNYHAWDTLVGPVTTFWNQCCEGL